MRQLTESIRKSRDRLLAFILVLALCAACLPMGMLPVSAEGEADSDSEFVGSFDLQEIFSANVLEIKENDVLLLQPEAVAQNIQAFVIPVTGGLLK